MMSERDGIGKLEEIARRYDSEKDFDRHLIVYGYKRLRRRLRGERVLEMGCASGVMTRLLARDVEHLDVLDGSRRYLDALAADPDLSSVEFHHGLFEEYYTERRYSDIVLARGLEHLAEPVSTLRAIRGWLSHEGLLHVIVPNADSLHRRVGVAMGVLERTDDLSDRDRAFGHQRVYDRALLEEHLTAARLRPVHFEGVFLKPLSNAQLESWEQNLLDAFDVVGHEIPEWCAEIYVTAERGS